VVPLAAGAALIAVVVAVVAIRGFNIRQAADTSPAASVSSGTSPTTSATSATSPTATPRPLALYRVAGTVTIEPAYLDCRTESVCYAWFTQLARSGVARPSERTSDGGATWQPIANPPDHEVFNATVEPSCPTARMCVAVTERDTLAMTTDSGASWQLDPLPAAAESAGWIDQVSCATVRECLVHLSGGLTSGTFLSTTNGGRSWTAATHVPADAPGSLQLLRCDPDGLCIGAVSAGLGTAYSPGQGPGLKIMRSADHGLSWSVSTINNVPPESGSAPGFLMSCSDAVYCVYAGGSGVAFTSNGGLTWQEPVGPPAGYGGTITSVSCAAGLDCSIALAPVLASQVPAIATTSDGMTWTAQPLPSSPEDPLQYVTLLSCPGPGGCVGLASTLSQEKATFLQSGGFSSGIVETSPQMLISSFAG